MTEEVPAPGVFDPMQPIVLSQAEAAKIFEEPPPIDYDKLIAMTRKATAPLVYDVWTRKAMQLSGGKADAEVIAARVKELLH